MDRITSEVAEEYHRMPLLELLEEENMMTNFFQKIPDSPRNELLDILRLEIRKKLQ